ncbi:NUDIX hydrolase [Flagellimonas halotolerans]|uniref:NUDIX domain-containing protein n=1 Tax=Flagellimonas halotolerans TaxID=3112164 RepID=A0ABU6IUI4_9FLAO|nr:MULTISPECIES: NUDIX domain-containing protein [unclassified Allomuricauda]MEC3966904.1 NUDIX domain-containing protein [Muricauda sp. SYSU M86414]MEC4266777.1 NUDIX domain-containing protein [Muricauda sp. SYSU M84420]
MDERVDILDERGKPTGESCLKSEAHRKGLLHPTVHVWLYTPDGRVLIQQRGKNKATHSLHWDVSVAGHVAAGEKIISAAIREVEEEIGIQVSETELESLGTFKAVHKISEDFIDAELHHIFLCKLNVPLSQLTKQESEVEDLALVPLFKFAEETWGLATTGKYVPHGPTYYKTIIKEIKRRT